MVDYEYAMKICDTIRPDTPITPAQVALMEDLGITLADVSKAALKFGGSEADAAVSMIKERLGAVKRWA